MMNLSDDMLLTYSGFFLVTVVVSCLVNGLALKSSAWAPRNKVKKIIRWQSTTKPSFGGISFYILFVISLSVFTMLSGIGEVTENKQLIGLIAASTLAFLVGFADDAYNTIPILKFTMQICCGLILIYSGIYIDLFASPELNYAITMFWIVGITNAMNLLDNMDAISSVVSIFIILSAMLIIYLKNDLSSVYFLLLLGVLSGILGFLYFNWHPSKIYMGDGGSQFLGLFLGIVSGGVDVHRRPKQVQRDRRVGEHVFVAPTGRGHQSGLPGDRAALGNRKEMRDAVGAGDGDEF